MSASDIGRSPDDPRIVEGMRRQLGEHRRLTDAGASRIGWKVGLGGAGAFDALGTHAPLVGFLTDRTLAASGSTVDARGWQRGLIEFEVAVYLGADLGAGASDEEAAAAVVALGPAIEVADADVPLAPERVTDILAGDVFHRGVVFGDRDPGRAGIDLSGLTGRISIDGDVRAVVDQVDEITGPYPEIVRTVADTLAAHGERLRAGDAIITGSIVPPIPITDGATFTFALDPIDTISVRLST